MTIMWPIGVLPARDVAFDIAPRSLRGPASVSGSSQVVSSDAGIWRATLGNIFVRGRDSVLAFRAISALMEGQLGSILVPRCFGYQPGADLAESYDLLEPVPHDDDATFDDDTEYVGSVNDYELRANASVRATTILVHRNYGGDIEPGQDFSLGERMYRVRTVEWTTSNNATVTFRPPLREAVFDDDHVEIDRPVCRMKLADDAAMNLDLAMRRFGSPSVTFIEDV